MPPQWEPSSFKHGIPRHDQVFVVMNRNYQRVIEEDHSTLVILYTGRQHPQTEREVEILVRHFKNGAESRFFHAMQLTDRVRRYREEHPDGWVD